MAEVKWIKLNVDMFDDEKIKIIQAMPEGDSLLYIWIRLILLAGKTNDGGYVYISESMAYTDEMLSIIFNKPLPIVRLAIDTFTSLGMIESDEKGIFLINFEKHQSLDKLEQIREQNRLRQRKFKEKKRLESKVTLPVTQSNAIDIDKEYIKEKIKRKVFKKPTIEEIESYCQERNNGINANVFYDFYESKDWMIGKNKMKDFKAAIRNWEQREKKELKEKGDFKRPHWLDMDL
ncbi:MAG: phage replisome organizer N-terminal domain-containing protein [Peptostreptococcaceae bacterium]|nr:phage replisome organizer N-terminal domain-containing protein [Peptostreptococcaceae bacterium]